MVLVVDDEPDIVAYLVAVLQDNGFQAMGESDAGRALETVRSRRPDLILLDIMMPGQTGLSLFRAIRSHEATAGLPVLFLTGVSREEDWPGLERELGARGLRPPEGYLEKPIAIAAFLQRVTEALEQHAGHDQDEYNPGSLAGPPL
jgi:DNA-binding response OmpR family regulator